MADLPEGFWDNLLDYIQDRTVIPVIGPELVTVRDGDRDVLGWLRGQKDVAFAALAENT